MVKNGWIYSVKGNILTGKTFIADGFVDPASY